MKGRWSVSGLVFVLACFSAAPLDADVPPAQLSEVAHLLDFLRHTPCAMIRNGKAHAGPAAYEHVRKKYEHFRDRIHSAEEFVAWAATKSLLSGQLYFVDCPGAARRPSGDWLLEELERFRGQ